MKRVLVLMAAAIAVLVSACVPSFPSGSSVTATETAEGTTLEWSWADPPDPEHYIVSYRVDVDGVEVAQTPSYVNSCTLVGLEADTEYVVTVTAYDDNGGWSGQFTGEYASMGTLTVNHTPTTTVPGYPGIVCTYSSGG